MLVWVFFFIIEEGKPRKEGESQHRPLKQGAPLKHTPCFFLFPSLMVVTWCPSFPFSQRKGTWTPSRERLVKFSLLLAQQICHKVILFGSKIVLLSWSRFLFSNYTLLGLLKWVWKNLNSLLRRLARAKQKILAGDPSVLEEGIKHDRNWLYVPRMHRPRGPLSEPLPTPPTLGASVSPEILLYT